MVSFNDESNSIPFSKQKGSPRGCTKWKAFIGRRGRGQRRADDLIFLWAMEKVYVTDYPTGADQIIPN